MTREAVDPRPGEIWVDMDPRENGQRTLIVESVDECWVHCLSSKGRRTRIQLRRWRKNYRPASS